MHVPGWDSDYQVPVVEGIDTWDVLNRDSTGHYQDMAISGWVGSFTLAALRQSDAAPLAHPGSPAGPHPRPRSGRGQQLAVTATER